MSKQEYLPIAYASFIGALGTFFWMLLWCFNASAFSVPAYSLLSFGGLLVVLTSGLSITKATHHKAELIAVLIGWAVSNSPLYLTTIISNKPQLQTLIGTVIWYGSTSFAALFLREKLITGSFSPTSKTMLYTAASVTFQLLMGFVYVLVLFSQQGGWK